MTYLSCVVNIFYEIRLSIQYIDRQVVNYKIGFSMLLGVFREVGGF